MSPNYIPSLTVSTSVNGQCPESTGQANASR
jgi:hypothetical protein